MRTVGIIAEYNPFHSGHAYHLEEAKKRTNSDYAVVVMSPDFVQRGTPAIFDKYTRTQMALSCGADLVLELPVCYATGSAEFFAQGAVTLLDRLGVIDALCFGSETADPSLFKKAAQFFCGESESYQKTLQEALKSGKTFPQARAAAVNAEDSSFSVLLSSPNNVLGIEYCKALHQLSSSIQPHPILRLGNGYESTQLQGLYCSATAIRQALLSPKESSTGSADAAAHAYIPEPCRAFFDQASAHPVWPDDLTPYLSAALLSPSASFSEIFDISSDLSDRISRLRFSCVGKSYAEVTALLKTKQMTEARIRRALLHLILSLTSDEIRSFREDASIYYARILGFRKEAAPLLHAVKKSSRIPLISKPANAASLLADAWDRDSRSFALASRMLAQDFYASHLYRSIAACKYHLPFQPEQKISPIVRT